MKDLNFTVNHSDIFIVMGGSGIGKSTLLRHMLGLIEPAKGEVLYGDFNFTKAEPLEREAMLRKFGVLYQSGALWSSMTLAENVGLPLEEFSDLTPAEIREVAALKLALVGLKGFEGYYPSQISGGMQKRAGLARAIALESGNSLLRRGHPPDSNRSRLAPARRPDLEPARQPWRDCRGRDPRTGEHLCNRQHSIFLDAESRNNDRKRRPQGTARPLYRSSRAGFSHARRRRRAKVRRGKIRREEIRGEPWVSESIQR